MQFFVSTEDLVLLRRPSQVAARYRAKRAESIKNDHIIFADEIKEDDEKFTPNPGIHDSEVRKIPFRSYFLRLVSKCFLKMPNKIIDVCSFN